MVNESYFSKMSSFTSFLKENGRAKELVYFMGVANCSSGSLPWTENILGTAECLHIIKLSYVLYPTGRRSNYLTQIQNKSITQFIRKVWYLILAGRSVLCTNKDGDKGMVHICIDHKSKTWWNRYHIVTVPDWNNRNMVSQTLHTGITRFTQASLDLHRYQTWKLLVTVTLHDITNRHYLNGSHRYITGVSIADEYYIEASHTGVISLHQ